MRLIKIRQFLTVLLVGISLLFSFSEGAIAAADIRSNASDLIYRGPDAADTTRPDIGARQQTSLPELPNQKQPMLKRSDPDAKILERVGEAFKDASAFLENTADEASARPEMKSNPARNQ
jgi:hypothetical protein